MHLFDRRQRTGPRLVPVIVAALLSADLPGAALAQSSDTITLSRSDFQALMSRLERLEREVQDLKAGSVSATRNISPAKENAGPGTAGASVSSPSSSSESLPGPAPAASTSAPAAPSALAANSSTGTDVRPDGSEDDPVGYKYTNDGIEFRLGDSNLTVIGSVNRAITLSNDGQSTDALFVDNVYVPSRFGLVLESPPIGTTRLRGDLVFAYPYNPSNQTSQTERTVDPGFDVRRIQAVASSPDWGALFLGYGQQATDSISEQDLSNTANAGYASIPNMAGGLLFRQSDGTLSSTNVADVFDDMSPGRTVRLRYDTPSVQGLTLGGGYWDNQAFDVGLRYSAEADGYEVAAGIGYVNFAGSTEDTDKEHQVGASVAMLFGNGLNFALSTGFASQGSGRDDATNLYGKLGYTTDFWSVGSTSFSADAGISRDVAVDGDQATAFGIQATQDFDRWNAQAYIGFRRHALDREGIDFDPLYAAMAGMLFRF